MAAAAPASPEPPEAAVPLDAGLVLAAGAEAVSLFAGAAAPGDAEAAAALEAVLGPALAPAGVLMGAALGTDGAAVPPLAGALAAEVAAVCPVLAGAADAAAVLEPVDEAAEDDAPGRAACVAAGLSETVSCGAGDWLDVAGGAAAVVVAGAGAMMDVVPGWDARAPVSIETNDMRFSSGRIPIFEEFG